MKLKPIDWIAGSLAVGGTLAWLGLCLVNVGNQAVDPATEWVTPYATYYSTPRWSSEEPLMGQGSYSSTPSPIVTTRKPKVTVTTPSVYYRNCDEARKAGVAPIYRGQPGYRSGLDRDGDGIACDK